MRLRKSTELKKRNNYLIKTNKLTKLIMQKPTLKKFKIKYKK